MTRSTGSNKAGNTVFSLWLFLFVCSFFYELPIIDLSYDRISPRLQDFVFLLGLVLYGKELFSVEHNTIYKRWSRIVIWFVCCSGFSCLLLLSSSYQLFSLLAALRYVEGLLLVKIALSHEQNRNVILWAAFGGLILDSAYCLNQLLNPRLIMKESGAMVLETMTGPLSSSYFELAQLLPLAAVLILALNSQASYSKIIKFVVAIITILNCWPILFTGSRTGLVLCVISLLLLFILKNIRNIFYISLTAGVAVFFAIGFNWEESELYTITRAIELEEDDTNSVEDRLDVTSGLDFSRYDNALFIPFIGAGFDIAPINGRARVDYGIHSMYLYPLEQSGILGFVLFLAFLWVAFKSLNKRRHDNPVAKAAFCYLIAMLAAGIGSHNFWREFSSGNVNTFIIFIFCLAVKQCNRNEKVSLLSDSGASVGIDSNSQ